MPIPALVATGLSLLPKLPALWESVAGLFGKSTPKKVEEAADLAKNVLDTLRKGNISPTQQVELQKVFTEHEEEMARILLEEKKLDYNDIANQRELNKIYIQSSDEYVRRTRPKILRRLFGLVAGYTILTPILIFLSPLIKGLDIEMLTSVLLPIGKYLFTLFGMSYLGYATARTMDKRNPSLKEQSNLFGKVVNLLA